MKIAVVIVRTLLGLAFIFFGLNAFFHFMNPPPPKGMAGAFIGAMFMSGYFYAVAALQIAGGLLLVSGRFVALGLTLLGPVVVNIMLFHIFIEHTGLGMASVFAVVTLFLIWGYRDRFAPLFKA